MTERSHAGINEERNKRNWNLQPASDTLTMLAAKDDSEQSATTLLAKRRKRKARPVKIMVI